MFIVTTPPFNIRQFNIKQCNIKQCNTERPLQSTRGFSLVEVIVVVGITMILLLAVVSVISPVLKLKSQVDSSSGLHLIASYMRECVASDAAWMATTRDDANAVNGSPGSMKCLTDRTQCNDGTSGYIHLDASMEPAANANSAKRVLPCLPNYDTFPSELNHDGFAKDGSVCHTFSESGNAQCPYRFDVYWLARCPLNEKTCYNPIIKVVGNMRVGRAAKPPTDINLARFQMFAVRGRADQNRVFILQERVNSGIKGGVCSNQGSYRVFTVQQDKANYVRMVTPDGKIYLEAGTYDCQISVPGLEVGGFKAVLMDLTKRRPILIGTSEFSPNFWGFSQTRSEIVGVFTLDRPGPIGVLELCSTLPTNANEQQVSLGYPTKYGTSPEVYSIMHCSVLSGSVN